MQQTERNQSPNANRWLTLIAALVPSVPEIRTLLARLIFKPSHRPSDIMQWSIWRRRHQATPQNPTTNGNIIRNCSTNPQYTTRSCWLWPGHLDWWFSGDEETNQLNGLTPVDRIDELSPYPLETVSEDGFCHPFVGFEADRLGLVED